MNTKLEEFVGKVTANGQISYGEVRRLQRDYLPSGITNREELEVLIGLNARLDRADKAWAQWLVGLVAEFAIKRQVHEHPIEEGVCKWVGRLLAAPTTAVGRRIAGQVRRELRRRQRPNVQQQCRIERFEDDLADCSLSMAEPSCCDRTPAPLRLSRRLSLVGLRRSQGR
jgi:hypothetical protein